MSHRNYSPIDNLLIGLDQALRTLFGRPQITARSNPANGIEEADLSEQERDLTGRMLRIDHTGEVCAQALYQGQALTARLPEVREAMNRSAQEENDHLDWCETRLKQLGGHTSYTNPFWYAGSFTMGALAGLAGDKWSLGFVAETEHQVVEHLQGHLSQIAPHDGKSRAILEQMKTDEAQHAKLAIAAGGATLPGPIRLTMKLTAKVMTNSVYWV